MEEFEVDKSAWTSLTKEEQADRKKEWGYVKNNLKAMAELMDFKPGYLASHKSLFFKGDLDMKGLGYKWPLFYLWYYPHLDEAKCRQIMEALAKLGGGPNGQAGKLLGIRTDILMGNRFAQIKYETDYGMLGGREKLIIEELMGEPGKGGFFDVTGYDEGRQEFYPGNLARCLMATGGVLRGLKGKRNEFCQYIWPHASHYIQKRFDERAFGKNTDMYLNRLKFVVSMILYFDEHPNTSKSDQYALSAKDRILKQYENGEIIGYLAQWFDEVKQEGWQPFEQ